jgi:hypothetical protein
MSHVPQGTAVAWVACDASTGTPTINAQHNVSSLTDDGVGLITVNYRAALASAEYALCGSARYTGGTTGIVSCMVFLRRQTTAARTTSATKIMVADILPSPSNAAFLDDQREISVCVYG